MSDGKQSHRYSEEDILSAIREADPATTTNVGNELGCSRQAADFRLRRLSEEEIVDSQKIGNSLIWSVSE
ncbi:ArsR family transcriptional regulator [Halococcus sp. IIIV-5B]|nr:ArsR family transcriptional regulator [Halococcus sp. IIIV-5B]